MQSTKTLATRKSRFGLDSGRSMQPIYFLAIVLMTLFVSVHYIRVAYMQAMDWSGWSIGEWLTNFEGGWVRRGLGGQAILLISDATHIQMHWIVLAIQITSYLCFTSLFLRLLSRKSISFWYFLVCFSPGFLLFTYYDSMAVGRKEVLLYLMFIVWLGICLRQRNTFINTVLFSTTYSLLTLVHEMFFFFSPYFVIAALFCGDSKIGSNKKSLLIPAFSAVGIVLGTVIFDPINGTAICESLLLRGLPESVCSGSITFGVPTPSVLLQDYITGLDQSVIFDVGLAFLLILIPSYLALRASEATRAQKRMWALVSAGAILFSAPLFIMATDWGRWISIHNTLVLCVLMIFLQNRASPSSFSERNGSPSMQLHKNIYALILCFVFLMLNASYSLRHCCDKNFFKPWGPVEKIVTKRFFSD
jgi:hypothetical protein